MRLTDFQTKEAEIILVILLKSQVSSDLQGNGRVLAIELMEFAQFRVAASSSHNKRYLMIPGDSGQDVGKTLVVMYVS